VLTTVEDIGWFQLGCSIVREDIRLIPVGVVLSRDWSCDRATAQSHWLRLFSSSLQPRQPCSSSSSLHRPLCSLDGFTSSGPAHRPLARLRPTATSLHHCRSPTTPQKASTPWIFSPASPPPTASNPNLDLGHRRR
jgi:hypothetical protein